MRGWLGLAACGWDVGGFEELEWWVRRQLHRLAFGSV